MTASNLSEKIEFLYAETFNGLVWKTLADPVNKRLFIESRENESKRVFFSAISVETGKYLWKEITFEEEPWWISLAAISAEILLFTLYTDSNNPDKKALLAFNVAERKIIWWKNNFALSTIGDDLIAGVDTKFGAREVILRMSDGKEASGPAILASEQNFQVIRPFQYHGGSSNFDTVRAFLEMKCQISPVISIEYSEYNSLILISAFTGNEDLANYLIVFNSAGEILMKETLGEHLKGIALDTFFIFSGYLIFVKNKNVLVSYKIV